MFFDPGNYIQKNNRADDRSDEGANETSAGEPNKAEDKAPDNSSDHPNNYVSYDSESSASSEMTCSPACDYAYYQPTYKSPIHEKTQEVV